MRIMLLQMLTPVLFVVMILMQSHYLSSSAREHPDMEVTNSILSRVATPVLQTGLLGLLLIAQMIILHVRIYKLEMDLEVMKCRYKRGQEGCQENDEE